MTRMSTVLPATVRVSRGSFREPLGPFSPLLLPLVEPVRVGQDTVVPLASFRDLWGTPFQWLCSRHCAPCIGPEPRSPLWVWSSKPWRLMDVTGSLRWWGGGSTITGPLVTLSHGSQNTASWFCSSACLSKRPQIPVLEAPKCWLQPWEGGLGALSPTSVVFSSCPGALGSGMGLENGLPCP